MTRCARSCWARAGVPVEIFSEFLDIERFTTADYVEAKAAFLRSKYADRNIRVVVAVAPSAFQFMLNHRDRVLPGVQVVHLALPRDVQAAAGAPARFRWCDRRSRSDGHLRAGAAPAAGGEASRHRHRRRGAGSTMATTNSGRGGPPRQAPRGRIPRPACLLRKYCSASARCPGIRSSTAPGYFTDGAGLLTTPRQSVEWMAAASTAPLYGPLSTFVGTGSVGGVVAPYEDQAKQAGCVRGAPVERRCAGIDPGLLDTERSRRRLAPASPVEHRRETPAGGRDRSLQTAVGVVAVPMVHRRRARHSSRSRQP